MENEIKAGFKVWVFRVVVIAPLALGVASILAARGMVGTL